MTTVFLVSSLTASTLSGNFDSNLLKLDQPLLGGKYKFERQRDKGYAHVTYSGVNDRRHLRITAVLWNDNVDIENTWLEATTTSAVSERPTTPQSGLPLGDRCVHNGDTTFTGPSGGKLHALSARFKVNCQIVGQVFDRSDFELQEGAVRYAVAKIRGLETTGASDARVNGRTVSGCRRGPSGDQLVPLDRWATAAGVEIVWNKRRGTAAFTHQGDSYVFALGATKLKKGGRWLDCADTLSWHGGHWYAPLGLLTE